MLQLFFKASSISSKDWERAYPRIESIATHFPLKLMRVEAYYGYQPQLDIDHFELRENIGTPDERLSFYGDWVSYTTGITVRFYKNWEKHVLNVLTGEETDPSKPITWFPHYPFRNDGTLPQANGLSPKNDYIDTRDALYEYAILAIGIMLENLLPNKVFLTAMEQNSENIEEVVTWLENHFNESFQMPIYFDKKRLLASFIHEYTDKSQAVCRMEHLFRKQYKRNMIFALENIGYKPTFDCYADILSDSTFGTFGFADVLDPWIAATQDLENTLDLIAASKKLTLERGEKKEVKEYDLSYILKKFLKEYILWTPLQREELDHFYTNKQALEAGDESLWGMLYRMTGNRVNICPMYASQQELFEAFMYHEPKKGKIFKQIIDEWVEKNVDTFATLKQKLEETQMNQSEPIDVEENDNDDENDNLNSIDSQIFINQYPKHEQPFIEIALSKNPAYATIEEGIENLQMTVKEMAESLEHREHINNIKSSSKKENIAYICRRIKKDIRCSVSPFFEQWLNDETDKNVLFYLTLMMSLKIYDRNRAYVRYRLLSDKRYWNVWRENKNF
jgi:hypothetical protein